jgi:hypothetical protein
VHQPQRPCCLCTYAGELSRCGRPPQSSGQCCCWSRHWLLSLPGARMLLCLTQVVRPCCTESRRQLTRV